jgi:hypothetical protein
VSSFAGYCDWCGKPVMHKTLFGTLHLCLTDEEKQMALQVQAAKSRQAGVSPERFLKMLRQTSAANATGTPTTKEEKES